MAMVQKRSRGLTGSRPSLPALPASGQQADPAGKLEDYKDFLAAFAAESSSAYLEP